MDDLELELNELVRSLTSDDPALSDEEISKWAERKRDILVLVLRFLADYGYTNSYKMLCNESYLQAEEVHVADGVDLFVIVQEFMDFHYSRLGCYPELVRHGRHQATYPSVSGSGSQLAGDSSHWNNSVCGPMCKHEDLQPLQQHSHQQQQQQHHSWEHHQHHQLRQLWQEEQHMQGDLLPQHLQQQMQQQQQSSNSQEEHNGCKPATQQLSMPMCTPSLSAQLPHDDAVHGHPDLVHSAPLQQQPMQTPSLHGQQLQVPQQVHTPPQQAQPLQTPCHAQVVLPTTLHLLSQQPGMPAATSCPMSAPTQDNMLPPQKSMPAVVSQPMQAAVPGTQAPLTQHASPSAQGVQAVQWMQPQLVSMPSLQQPVQLTASAPQNHLQASFPVVAPAQLQPVVAMPASLPVTVGQPVQMLPMPIAVSQPTETLPRQLPAVSSQLQSAGAQAVQQQCLFLLPAAPLPAAAAALPQAMQPLQMQTAATARQPPPVQAQTSAQPAALSEKAPSSAQPAGAQPSTSQPGFGKQPGALAAHPLRLDRSTVPPVLPQTPALVQGVAAQLMNTAPQPRPKQQGVAVPSAQQLALASAALAPTPASLPAPLALPRRGQQVPVQQAKVGPVPLPSLPFGLSVPVLRTLSACTKAVEVVQCTIRLATQEQVSQLALVSELSLAPPSVLPSQLFSFRAPESRPETKRKCSQLQLTRVQEDVLYALVGCMDVGWNMTNITPDTKNFLVKKYGIDKASLQLFVKNRRVSQRKRSKQQGDAGQPATAAKRQKKLSTVGPQPAPAAHEAA